MNFLDPIVTSHPLTGAERNVTPDLLREVYLVPLRAESDPSELLADSRAPWAESHAIAPRETAQSVMAGLRALILATPRMERGEVDLSALPEGTRLHRHCQALMALWEGLGDGLPADLQVMRHVIAADGAVALEPLPLIDTGAPRFAARAEESLRAALLAHHGPAPEAAHSAWADRTAPLTRGAPEGSSLHTAQHGLLERRLAPQPHDDTLAFWGVRDLAEEAELAAAMAQRRIDAGAEPSDIALLLPDDATYHPHLRDAFDAAGIPLSGLPEPAPRRDLARETLLHFLLALRAPAPAMALASLYVSPLMPWPADTGAALARAVMQGRFDPRAAQALEGRAARLFRSLRADPPRDAADVAARLDLLAQALTEAPECREDVALLRSQIGPLKAQLAGSAQPEWDALFAMLSPQPAPPPAGERIVEGVSVFTESALPWRPARHLIVLGMAAGHYPRASGVSPLFLDSELAELRAATGLDLPDRGAQLAQRLELFRRQLCAATQSATFLCPMRGAGWRGRGASGAVTLGRGAGGRAGQAGAAGGACGP